MAQRTAMARRRPRDAAALLAFLALAATLGLHDELALPGFWDGDPHEATMHSIRYDQAAEASPETEEDALYRRALLSTLESEPNDLAGDYDAAYAAANDDGASDASRQPLTQVQPYTLEDAVNEHATYTATFAVLVYNPRKDQFVALFAKDHKWIHAVDSRMTTSIVRLAYFLRKLFPERFQGGESEEFAIALGAGDFPHVEISALPHAGKAPVLQFGSAFRDRSVFENMVAMPMPERHHLHCFVEYVARGKVCKKLKPNPKGEMVFGDEFRLFWEDLMPQLVWRGTDFGYLPRLGPRMIKPWAYRSHEGEAGSKEAAVRELRTQYDQLLPRWKGVLLTAESELEAERTKRELPQFNMKFATASLNTSRNNLRYLDNGQALPVTKDADDAIKCSDVGLAPGGTMYLPELAKYKYHIDLGGGGGTTWTGTIQKLAMPGLLFHHVTPMKDYIHDLLVPWRHYIPVAHDLSDLKSKFDWAEANPEEAKQIADRATEFMRHLVTKEGYGEMVDEVLIEPLRRVIEAYQPLSTTNPGMSWVEFLEQSPVGKKMVPVMECTGISSSCQKLGGDVVKQWSNTRGRYPGGMWDDFSCPSCVE